MPQARFTKEFRDEAVRLALTSGRSRREIAADLGVGLSTLRNWIDRRRDREIDDPPEDRQEDVAAELKRLRRENEILTPGSGKFSNGPRLFSPRREVDEVPVHRCGEREFPLSCPLLSGAAASFAGPSSSGLA